MKKNILGTAGFILGIFLFAFIFTVNADNSGILLPQSDGNYTQWTPKSGTTHYTQVNEVVCNGATNYNFTTTVGSRDSYRVDIASIPNSAKITQIIITPCASANTTGGTKPVMNVFYRYNGTNSSDSGAYLLAGKNPVVLATTSYSSLNLIKSAQSTLEIGAVLTSGIKGAKLGNIQTSVTYIPLYDPTDLVAFVSTSTTDTINLSWSDNATTEDAYVVERSTNNINWTQIASTSANVVSYVDSGLYPGVLYYHRVRAYNLGGFSLYSNVTSTTITSVPVAPSSLSSNVSSNLSPTVSLTSPINDATAVVPATITLSASASDLDGSISKVEFYQGGVLLDSDTVSPYSYLWASVPVGLYQITAVATDNGGAVTASVPVSISVTSDTSSNPPSISMSKPINGATYSAPANFYALVNVAPGTGRTLTKVEFYQDGTLISTANSPGAGSGLVNRPYLNLGQGSYDITVKVYDNVGNNTSTTSTVSVNAPAEDPFIVTIPNGSIVGVAPATVTLKAKNIPVGTSGVSFYNGATLLGTTTGSYEFVWSNVLAGVYSVTAVTDLGVTTAKPFNLTIGATNAFSFATYTHTELAPDGVTSLMSRLMVPLDAPYMRAILLNYGGSTSSITSGLNGYADKTFNQFLHMNGLGYIGTQGYQVAGIGGNAVAMNNSLLDFAAQSGRTEIVNTPFVVNGFSAGGAGGRIFADHNPTKIIAFAPEAQGLTDLTINKLQIMAIPISYTVGNLDANKSPSLIVFNTYRPQGAIWSFESFINTQHINTGHSFLNVPFLEHAITLRLPTDADPRNGPITLNPVSENAGWLADLGTISSGFTKIDSYSAFTGDKSSASWLLDKDIATIFRAFANYDVLTPTNNPVVISSIPAQTSAFSPLEVNPGTSLTINVDTSRFANCLNVQLYDKSTPLGVAFSCGGSGVISNLQTGIHDYIAVATDTSGVQKSSAPIMVIVKLLGAPSFTSTAVPVLISHPVSTTVSVGSSATFTVHANGTPPLTYQWQDGTTDILGATNATYTTPITTLSNNGTTFRSIVANAFGSVISDSAILTTIPVSTSTLEITLNWVDNSLDEDYFLIERKIDNGVFSQIATSTANSTSYQDIDIATSTTYVYRMRAYNAVGYSSYSNMSTTTTP